MHTGISEKKQFRSSCGTQGTAIWEPVAQKATFTFCNGVGLPLAVVQGKTISTSSLVWSRRVSDGAEQGSAWLTCGMEFALTSALGKTINCLKPSLLAVRARCLFTSPFSTKAIGLLYLVVQHLKSLSLKDYNIWPSQGYIRSSNVILKFEEFESRRKAQWKYVALAILDRKYSWDF